MRAHNLYYSIIVIAFGLFPLTPHKAKSISIIILFIMTIVLIIQEKKINLKPKNFFFGLFVFPLILGLINTEDFSNDLRIMSMQSSLLLTPLLMALKFNNRLIDVEKLKKIFFRTYFISTTLYVLINFIYFFIYENLKYPIYDSNFFRNAVLEIPIFSEHPIYSSIIVSISVFFGFILVEDSKKGVLNKGIIFSILLKIIFLMLLMSKGVLIALLLSFLFLILIRRKFRILLLLTITLIFLFFVIPHENNRFNEIFTASTYEKIDTESSTSIRTVILSCNFSLIKKPSLFGQGSMAYNNNLNECLNDKGVFKKYNSHNQYFNYLGSSGLIGLIAFILWFYFIFKSSWINKDFWFVSIIIFYFVGFLFENILSRQSGVILFSFITTFLYLTSKKIPQKK